MPPETCRPPSARIKAKKLRYAAEFFDKLFGKHTQKRLLKFIGALAELQDAPGALNDVTVARRTARVAAGDNGAPAVRAGQMMSVHDRNESHLLRQGCSNLRALALRETILALRTVALFSNCFRIERSSL